MHGGLTKKSSFALVCPVLLKSVTNIAPASFSNAISAMAVAVGQLRALPVWNQWITFVAQGQGEKSGRYHFAEIHMLGDRLDVGERPLNVAGMIDAAHTNSAALVVEDSHYSVAAASSQEVAQLLDAIFRHHFGIRPFDADGDDYPVGAEWRGESN